MSAKIKFVGWEKSNTSNYEVAWVCYESVRTPFIDFNNPPKTVKEFLEHASVTESQDKFLNRTCRIYERKDT